MESSNPLVVTEALILGKKELYVCPKGHEFLLAEPFSINFNWFDKEGVFQHREVPTCVVCLIDRLEGMNIGVKKVQKEVS